MALYLTIDATEGQQFQIEATGRNPDLVADLDRNLILETYRDLAPEAPPLHLKVHNEIPLGMGCGSSAAALLAGVHLANHFGALGLTAQQILEEACMREGHPDNVAACFHGGMTVSAMHGRKVTAATFGDRLDWRLLLAMPATSLATEKARALLPATYSRADAVANIQATALLVAAFAQNRAELLRTATADRIHQPFRAEACSLLPALLPLAGSLGIYCVTLSGAGPSVLLITDPAAPLEPIRTAIAGAAYGTAFEVVETSIAAASLRHA
jgi:homoserine kinase